ncbi:hypothetical protein TUM12370_38280 [Salmonella enterica subsp. enterica serovar Choleraesuis]|nr:hypothetical protein TUM12370_38280 [Salmonella enterica subsp. enterica serovar Choleraesuis]
MAYTGAGKVAPAPVRLAAALTEKALIASVAVTTVATVVRITFIMSPAEVNLIGCFAYRINNRSV